MVTVGYGIAALLGLLMGSFAGATVWRLRARQLAEDKTTGERVPARELKRLKPLLGRSFTRDRSRCLECHHELRWYDLIPLVSWLSTRGKCRYCRKPIGWFEPLIELGTATVFVLFYHHWVSLYDLTMPLGLGLWGIALVMLVILFAYDAKWFLLPDIVTFPLIAVGAVLAALNVLSSSDMLATFYSTMGAVAVLGGLYLVLWLVSKGKWVGFGDVKLGLALGLLIGEWHLALLALFLANLVGTLIVLPGIMTGRLSRKAQVPFGPLLISGFFIALLWGTPIIEWYVRFTTTLML